MGTDFAETLQRWGPTYIHPFNGPLSRTTWVNQYQKGKTIWILLKEEAVWKWHQLGHMQVCTSFQADNDASTPPLSFLQAGCPSCHPTNSVKALKAQKMGTRFMVIPWEWATGTIVAVVYFLSF